MCTCASPLIDDDITVPRRSLHRESRAEADRHKWYLSEQAGRDRGQEALFDWIQNHWYGYLRERWLQHLLGLTYWVELKPTDFGLLPKNFLNSPYFNEIVELLREGGENLSILNHAIKKNLIMDEVEAILLAIDINSCRMKSELEDSLRPGPCPCGEC